jgi:CheY-like chemotaxis protein
MLTGKTIYIVEDNATNLAIISSILRRHNAQIRYDRWGIETIERLASFGKVDLIILDLMFPRGVTGYDVFDQLKKHPQFANIPVVAVSAADPQVEMPKAKAKGFKGFISKPINHKLFPQQIAALIEGQEIWEDDNLHLFKYAGR